jgi:hypothetical protein
MVNNKFMSKKQLVNSGLHLTLVVSVVMVGCLGGLVISKFARRIVGHVIRGSLAPRDVAGRSRAV